MARFMGMLWINHNLVVHLKACIQETYALKRKLRQCENRLKDLRKEREEVSAQLRSVEPQKYKTPTKFNKQDVIKELKWVGF